MLTEQRRKYAEFRARGYSKREAAIAAGCPAGTATQAAARLEKNEHVQMAIAAINGGEPLPMQISTPKPIKSPVIREVKAPVLPAEVPEDPLPVTKDPVEFLRAVMVCASVPINERNKAAMKLADLEAKNKKPEEKPKPNKFARPTLVKAAGA